MVKMTRRELEIVLKENKRHVDQAMEEMAYHSREFDRKIAKILASL